MLSLLGVVLFLTTGAAALYHDLQSQINVQNIDDLLDDRPSMPEGVTDSFEGRAVNILVMGSDSRNGQVIDDGTEGMRSDTTMIVHISKDRSRMDVVSIPRDTMVSIPSCTLPDGSQSDPYPHEIFNSAFSTGAGDSTDSADVKYAAACTQKTVEKMTDIYIDDYMVVDFTGFETMVDSLGGVPMYVEEDVDDDKADLHLSAGCQTLNGAQALGYARARYSLGDGSDISRIGRQQQLVAAIMRKALSKNLFTDTKSLYDFTSSALSTLTVSPRLGDLKTLSGLAASVAAIGTDKINFVTMPNEEDAYDPNRVAPSDAADDVWDAIINDRPIPAEAISLSGDGTSPSQAAAPPSDSTDDSSADSSDASEPSLPGNSGDSGDSAPSAPSNGGGTTSDDALPTVDPATQCG